VLRIGVLGLQGDVSEHVRAMRQALEGRGEVALVRRSGIIPDCDGLAIPGGESTTLSKLIVRSGIDDEIKKAGAAGIPILATCAGLVLVSRKIQGDARVKSLGLTDTTIGRNIFGTQKDSFEADLDVQGFDRPYRAVFIRAPAIVEVGEHVQALAKVDENIVAARQKNVLSLAFHPELTDDLRFHQLFLDLV
jgi:pyridoxal 5'-phosphate synthase pdxT subunit